MIKAEQQELANLLKKERDRERFERPPSPTPKSDISRVSESTVGTVGAPSRAPSLGPPESSQGTLTSPIPERSKPIEPLSPQPEVNVFLEKDLVDDYVTRIEKKIDDFTQEYTREYRDRNPNVTQALSNIQKMKKMLKTDSTYTLDGLKLKIRVSDRPFNFENFYVNSRKILNAMFFYAEDDKDLKFVCKRFRDVIKKLFDDFTNDLKELKSKASKYPLRSKPFAYMPQSPGEKPSESGSGIAKYRNIHGGSINSFITAMHQRINIKNIIRFNKSAYVINI